MSFLNIKAKSGLSKICSFIFIFLYISLLLIYPQYSYDGILQGLNLCFNTVIPSLFPFIVLSVFISKSGVFRYIEKIFAPFMKYLFKLPSCCFIAIFMGITGGYPTGAKTVAELYKNNEINASQANLAAIICLSCGPGFAVSAVGIKMLDNKSVGLILFFSQIIAFFISGILFSFFQEYSPNKKIKNHTPAKLSDCFIQSCSSSLYSVLHMSSLILIFSCFISIITQSGFLQLFCDLFQGLNINPNILKSSIISCLEITSGCNIACCLGVPFELISFFLGFGGLCVHFQIFSILPVHIKKLKFILYRLFFSLICFFSTHILLEIFPYDKPVFFNTSHKLYIIQPNTDVNIVFILFMCVVFIFSVDSIFIKYKKSRN